MEKFKNILNREDYLKTVNEGRIGDFLKGGVKKIKSFFSFVAKKVKNIIVFFDSSGNVMPVVSPHAIADHFNRNKKIQVFGSKEMDMEIRNAGGSGCETTATSKPEESYSDEAPNGQEEFYDWCHNGGLKNSNYYKNLMSLQKLVESKTEKFNKEDVLNERLEDSERIPYGKKTSGGTITGVENFYSMDSSKFEEKIKERIDYFCKEPENEDDIKNPPGNILIFGAPGIGKSTIPRNVVKAYNDGKKTSDRIGLISINCANLQPGDLLMPSFPKPKDVLDYLENSKSEFENLSFLDELSDEEKENLKKTFKKSNQVVANNAPAPWLPCYKRTGDEFADEVLDLAANGGICVSDVKVVKSKFGKLKKVPDTYKTGSGGIILLDEFLRSDPRVFSELLNFLFEREVAGWVLGSKWFIMACSNRPCDDTEVDNNWKGWNSAQRGRWPEIWNFEPSPKEWKKWARDKGFDENLLKFIFDEKSDGSMDANGEYTRWHRMAKRDSSAEDSHQQVSPRNWMFIHDKFMRFAKKHKDEDRFKNGFSTSNMTIDEIKETLEGVTDVEFAEEITDWFEKFCGDLKIENIIEDPINTPSPLMGKIKDPTKEGREERDESKYNEVTIIDVIVDQMEKRYNPENENAIEPTDKELSNIMIWLGINFKNNFNVISTNFANQLHYIFKKNGFWDFHKFGLLFMAAFPEPDYMEVINYPGLKETLCDNSHGNTDFFLKENDDILEVVKGFAKKYFTWNINEDGELDSIYNSKITNIDEVKTE